MICNIHVSASSGLIEKEDKEERDAGRSVLVSKILNCSKEFFGYKRQKPARRRKW